MATAKTLETGTRPGGPAPGFLEDCSASALRARAAILELLRSAGAEAFSAKELRARFGLAGNLAWKLSKLLGEGDGVAVTRHLPGQSGLEIVLRAAEDAGAPAAVVARVTAELARFDAMVARHAGDRAGLELMLESSLAESGGARRLESRKLSFQGNGATWGVQASVQVAVQIIAPNAADPLRIDMAQISGLLGFRRLRSTVRWPLVRFQWDLDPERLAEQEIEPLEGDAFTRGAPPWMRAFCSACVPPIEARAVAGGTLFELCEGPAGNTAAADCLVGTVVRDYAPVHGDATDSRANLFTTLSTPAEAVLFDVYVHRDAAFPAPPEPALTSRLELGADELGPAQSGSPLPLVEGVQLLGSGPPIFATPLVLRHSEMMEAAIARLGHRPADFTGYRIVVPYPPIPARLALSCPLPPAP